MKAAVFDAIGKPFQIEDIPVPQPGPGQVLVKVGRCGICGSDLHMTECENPMQPAKGFVMGHEFAGEVVELGKGVERVAVGARVSALPITGCGACAACLAGEPSWCSAGMVFLGGGFAQYALAGARECLVLPEGLSLADGAVVEPLAVALHGIRMAPGISGSHVRVLGAGPIGLGAIYWASRFGASKVEVVEGNPARAELARAMGATAVIAPDLAADPLARMRDMAGPEFVIECVGKPGLLADAISQVRPRGTVVSLGFCVSPDLVSAAAAGVREATVKFPVLYTLADYQTTIDALSAGHVEPRQMVTGTTGLGAFPEVFESLRKPVGQCKVMVDPWAD